MRGKFITLEGCDGCGKSTQIAMLKTTLRRRGVDFAFTREPGGTDISEKIRSIISDPTFTQMDDVTELLLYAAARRQHTAEFIGQQLRYGKLVFCDRYSDSTVAYQGYGRGIDLTTIELCNKIAMGGQKIDLTVFFDLSPTEAFIRKGGADKNDRLECEKIDFYNRIYEGYKIIAQREPERVAVVDAHGSAKEVHQRLVDTLEERGILI